MNLYQLKDGTPVSIHTLQPEDEPCIIMHFRKLSDQSRYFRFLNAVKCLPRDTLLRLMDVDPVNQVALCMFTESTTAPCGVGIARYIRDRNNPTQAEIAIVIMDDFQNRGAGTILLQTLIQRAHRNGIKTLTGISLPENLRLQRLIRKFGAGIRFDGQLLHISIDVSSQNNLLHSAAQYRVAANLKTARML